jgi:hypothetical protein
VQNANKSFQQLDPVGGYSVRPVTILLCILIFLYAAGSTAGGWQPDTVPWLAFTALGMSALSSVGAIFWSSPLRAPFSNGSFLWVVGGATLAMVLAAAASWTSDPVLGAAWGPAAVGMSIAQLAPYRPARHLVAATALTALVGVSLVVLRTDAITHHKPVLVAVVEVTVPLVAIGLASAAYAAALGRSVDGRKASAIREAQAVTDQLREGIVRSVQHDRVTILNLHVVPFFADLLQRNTVRKRDRERALSIADSIRTVMIADVERTWLDAIVDEAGRRRLDESVTGSEMVEDDSRLASAMNTEQRTATRALLVALFDHPGFDPDGFGIVLTKNGSWTVFTLTAKLDNEESILRSELAPYFAVMRIMFATLQLTFQAPTLALRFSYEHK